MAAPLIAVTAARVGIDLIKKYPWLIPLLILAGLLPLFVLIVGVYAVSSALQVSAAESTCSPSYNDFSSVFINTTPLYNLLKDECPDEYGAPSIGDGGTGAVSPLGWASPVPVGTPVTDEYRDRDPENDGRPDFSSLKYHNGIDFGLRIGSPLYSVADGIVVAKDQNTTTLGYTVIIYHPTAVDGGMWSRYGHLLNTNLVSVGQRVVAGQQVAQSGASAGPIRGAPHLHLEFLVNGKQCNPRAILAAGGIELPAQRAYRADGRTLIAQNNNNDCSHPNRAPAYPRG